MKKTIISLLTIGAVALSLSSAGVPVEKTAEAQWNDCGSGQYKCGYGQTWTCCNSGDRCCAYEAVDGKTWYTCVVQNQQCPD